MSSPPALYRLPSTTPGSASGIYVRSVAAVLVLLGVAVWATTQWSAWQLHFVRELGAPWLHLAASRRNLSLLVAAASGALALAVLQWPRTRWTSLLFAPVAALAFTASVHPIYAPWDFFVWDWRFGRNPQLALHLRRAAIG